MINKIAWLGLTLLFSSLACARETVVYQFGASGLTDGSAPNGGLVFDAEGNIYGTTVAGGSFGFGTAFELTPSQDGTWQEIVLYNFCSAGTQNFCADGQFPQAGVIFDRSGNLYGTTVSGGANGLDDGVVFELSPPSQPGGSWTEQVLWSFGGANDGAAPYGGLAMDAIGNLYGTTSGSVTTGVGVVFELSSGQNGWTESLLHIFCLEYPDCSDGAEPKAGVTFDNAGNLYGTTVFGGQANRIGWGVAYELSPVKSGWAENVLKVFSSVTGGRTSAGITIDPAGHLYGGSSEGGADQCGGFFRLNTFVVFPLSGGNGCSPQADLLYSSGALFGSASKGGANSQGALFEFTAKGNKVTQTILYNFCQQANCADGSEPNGSLTLRNGRLYGATLTGGAHNAGVIYQIAE